MSQDVSSIIDIGRGETLALPIRENLLGGLPVQRKFSKPDVHPYDDGISWITRKVEMMDWATGVPTYSRDNVEVPAHWGNKAVLITVSKYLFGNAPGTPEYEDSLRHAFDRIANTYTVWGWRHGYFAEESDAVTFNWELKAMLVRQMWAPNSPVWFNVGHWEQWRWGRPDLREKFSGRGNKAYKAAVVDGEVKAVEFDNVYVHPQCSACFLTEVEDSMEAILAHGVTEGRIFAAGSGVGLNLSTLRSSKEPISGKGRSSGPVAFDSGWDRMAAAIKSGGKTRRAARMILMDSNHPDVFDFINTKAQQDRIAKIILREHNTHVALRALAQEKSMSGTTTEMMAASIILALPLVTEDSYAGEMDALVYGETVAHQNANHSISLLSGYWEAFHAGGMYSTRWVTKPDKIVDTFRAEELLRAMSNACWENAEPGCHNNDWINLWSPYKAIVRLNTSNPCLTADAMVAGKGLTQITELMGSTPEVVSGDGELRVVDSPVPTGVKQVFRVRTKSGYSLDATSDHLFSTVGKGDKSVAEIDEMLRSHEAVAVALRGADFGDNDANVGLAYLAGRAVACGSLSHEHVLCVPFGKDEEDLMAGIKSKIAAMLPDAKFLPSKTPAIVCGCAALVDAISELVDCTPFNARLKRNAFRLTKRATAALLKGIIEGGANAFQNELEVHSPSADLLRQTQLLLLSFNVMAKIGEASKKEDAFLTFTPSAVAFLGETIGLEPVLVNTCSRGDSGGIAMLDDNLTDQVESIVPLGEQPVYDLTELVTSHFVANGFVVHNCSEYIAPNNTSCNLSSFNVFRFFNWETRSVDAELLEHGVSLAMLVADLNIEEGGFPIPEIAVGTYVYRTTGIGYANLGGLIMALGLPYDSNEGRFLASQLFSCLTASCWKASAKMGEALGGFIKQDLVLPELRKVIALHTASHRLSLSMPAIADGRFDAQDAVDAALVGLDTPVFESVTAKRAMDAQLRAFDFNGPMSGTGYEAAVKLGCVVSPKWEELATSKVYRNSFVSCTAPTGCLVGTSLIATSRGLTRLARLGNPNGTKWQDVDFKVQTDEGAKDATKFFINGVAETRLIETYNGYTTQGTLKHQLKVFDRQSGRRVWKRYSDIAEGDLIPMALDCLVGAPQLVWLPAAPEWHGNVNPTKFPALVTPELGEFVGYFMGDGALHQKGIRLSAVKSDTDVQQHLLELGERLFGIKGQVEPDSENCVAVTFHSVALRDWMIVSGFTKYDNGRKTKGKHPHVPDLILASNDRKVYGAFLRGLFEADGTTRENIMPSVSSHDHPFIQDVQQVMLSIGFPSYLDESTISGHSGKPLNRLRLLNQNFLGKWQKEVGFIGSRKRDLLVHRVPNRTTKTDMIPVEPWILEGLDMPRPEKWKIGGRFNAGTITREMALRLIEIDPECDSALELKERLRFHYDEVVSNKDGGMQPTYDLSVPENVTYVANGFISHNTISSPLGIYDAGTTSAEPDYTLVKYKALAGGGTLRMFNTLALSGIRTLGYSEGIVREAAFEVAGIGALIDACGDTAIASNHLMQPWPMGDTLSGPVRQAFEKSIAGKDRNAFIAEIIAKTLRGDLSGADDLVFKGKGHIEAFPWLLPQHLPVFDCADKTGDGVRAIAARGHMRMLAAIQPFISGATSKTVNLPYSATRDEIFNCFVDAHEMGVKCIALYRSDSKGVSVYQADTPEALKWDIDLIWSKALAGCQEEVTAIETAAAKPFRRKLPGLREARVVKFDIGGQLDGFLIVGVYPDGTCGEVFGRLGQGGSFAHGMFESFCKAFSAMLQWGVPVDRAVKSFKGTAFDPSGFVKVGDSDSKMEIRSCKSAVDVMMQILEWMFPASNNYILRDIVGREARHELGDAVIEVTHAPESTAMDGPVVVDLSSAEMCPQCHALAMIADGRCRRCTNCDWSGGGCG